MPLPPTSSIPPKADIRPLQDAVRQRNWEQAVALGQTYTYRLPHHGLGWALLGEALVGVGDFALAADAYEQASRSMPTHAGVWVNWGSCLETLNQLNQSMACYEQALNLDPTLAAVHYNFGTLRERMGRIDEAMLSYEAAMMLAPLFAPAFFNAARLCYQSGNFNRAMSLCESGLVIATNFADAQALKARILLHLNRPSEALACLIQAQQNGYVGIQLDCLFGRAYRCLHRNAEALGHLHSALEVDPKNVQALSEIALTLEALGRINEARLAYDALAHLALPGARIRRALLLSRIMQTSSDVLLERAQFEEEIEHLVELGDHFEDPLLSIGQTVFYLHYHGRNDRQILTRLAKLYLNSCASLAHAALHTHHRKITKFKPRIGFFSQYFSQHVISVYFSHIIHCLNNRANMDVWLISVSPIDRDLYFGFDARTLQVPYDLSSARERISALELDVLIYLDVGMEPFSTFLAYGRLAHAQAALVGMPVTTGIPNIDWFVSSILVEPLDAAEHYSERLLLLSRVLFYFTKPALPLVFRDREMLGLPLHAHLYVVPVKLHKIHPDFDALLDQILLRDPLGIALFFKDDADPDWRFQFGRRLDKTLSPGPRKQIRFAQWLSEDDLMQVVHNSDVVLDPLHFGMGATGRLIFAIGTPVVTLRGPLMRARVCASMCDLLDLDECVTNSGTEYVDRALHFARDAVARQNVFDKMHRNAAALYENDSVIPEFEEALLRLARGQEPLITAVPAPTPAHRSSPAPGLTGG